MIQSRQIRAARALLNWSQQDLAKASGIALSSIKNIENDHTVSRRDTLAAIQATFEKADVEFLSNSGVRVKSRDVEVYEGPERFDEFYDYIYEHLRREGGDVCVSAVDERLFAKYRKDPELHRKRMKELVDRGDVIFRVLATESNFVSTYAQYKWQPKQSGIPTSFYAFGDCLALISFTNDTPPYVVLLKSGPFAEAYRHAFEALWKDAKPMPSRSGKE